MLSRCLIVLLQTLRGWLVSYEVVSVEMSIELCKFLWVLPTLGRPMHRSWLNLLSWVPVELSSLGRCPWVVPC